MTVNVDKSQFSPNDFEIEPKKYSSHSLFDRTDMHSRDLLDDKEYSTKRNALKDELLRIDELLRQTENRAEKWLKLTEEVFDFAT